MIAALALVAVLIAAALHLARLWIGPTPYDRVLMGHALWGAAALVVAGAGALTGSHAALDAALALVLFDAMLVLGAVKALRRNSFQPALAPLDDGGAP
jgi:multisubunit Na+/H+ antiporter MnhF subunit